MLFQQLTTKSTGNGIIISMGIILMAAIFALACSSQPSPSGQETLPVVFRADFEDDTLDAWQPTDSNAWRIEKLNGNRVLSLYSQSDYEPEVRSPININWIKDLVVGDFILDLKMRSTTEDYGHRDMCLFFGCQDSAHFYYVHLANEADPHAHSIFLVNGEPRVSIAKTRTEGIVWGEDWHNVRVVRKVSSGMIEVYYDDLDRPIMTAMDTLFEYGKIGVGSFDDKGYFDDIMIMGDKKPIENQ
jgi:hypothetical protein